MPTAIVPPRPRAPSRAGIPAEYLRLPAATRAHGRAMPLTGAAKTGLQCLYGHAVAASLPKTAADLRVPAPSPSTPLFVRVPRQVLFRPAPEISRMSASDSG